MCMYVVGEVGQKLFSAFSDLYFILCSELGSSVIIVSGYGLDDQAIEVRSLQRQKDFSSNLLCPDQL
jgi:hypothetical protein